jgi:hypothetical protein
MSSEVLYFSIEIPKSKQYPASKNKKKPLLFSKSDTQEHKKNKSIFITKKLLCSTCHK